MSAAPIDINHAKTREERMRWARWAVRFFARFLPPDERDARGLAPAEPPPLTYATGEPVTKRRAPRKSKAVKS